MKQPILKHRIWLRLLSIFLALPTWLSAASVVTIEYEVWMAEPHSHYCDVAMTVAGIEQDTIDLIMPVWTPGSYVIRDYARHVITLSAVDGSGRPLPVEKISKCAWRIHSNRAARLTVRYRVYAFDDTMRESCLDEAHAFIHGASLFMYVDGFLRHPVRL
jgi:predicted metalloprotease with PDZ domain